ncbi:hypothetical protein M413DRAFT_430438 [Hebeloma cylindrosporum]|uniref:Uncharacterized protein n=1 Tax=Hebeloma cylindrosporum TaxID=76867 RepID=A0A0C3CA65_HEBCY|nr:hypothetical protein M413DRAFT_430438 [Hebeloma cylindrosporum h7]
MSYPLLHLPEHGQYPQQYGNHTISSGVYYSFSGPGGHSVHNQISTITNPHGAAITFSDCNNVSTTFVNGRLVVNDSTSGAGDSQNTRPSRGQRVRDDPSIDPPVVDVVPTPSPPPAQHDIEQPEGQLDPVPTPIQAVVPTESGDKPIEPDTELDDLSGDLAESCNIQDHEEPSDGSPHHEREQSSEAKSSSVQTDPELEDDGWVLE